MIWTFLPPAFVTLLFVAVDADPWLVAGSFVLTLAVLLAAEAWA